MNPPAPSGAIAPFFTDLLRRFRAGSAPREEVLRYMVALFLSGRSGAGKDTLRAWLLKNIKTLGRVITTTTRPPEDREGRMEENGVDYFFVNERRFEEMWATGLLLERDLYAGNHYGSSLEGALAVLANGQIPILQITVEGVFDLLPHLAPDRGHGVFLYAPTHTVEGRIRARAASKGQVVDEGALALRLQEGEEEQLTFMRRFMFPFGTVVTNADLEVAKSDIIRVTQPMVDDLIHACLRAISAPG